MPPGPGNGWGFPNDNPDQYGWVDYGDNLPLGADRTAEYFFPRYFAVPPDQMFIQTYYNPYETRGQRYIPLLWKRRRRSSDGGRPPSSAVLACFCPMQTNWRRPVVRVPGLTGRVEAGSGPSADSGMNP